MTKKTIKILMIQVHKILLMDYHEYLLYKKDWITLIDNSAFTVWNLQRKEVLSFVNLVGRGLSDLGENYDFSDDLIVNERWL